MEILLIYGFMLILKKFEIKFSGTPKFATVGEVVEYIEILTA